MGAKLTACTVAIAVCAALAAGQEHSSGTSDALDRLDSALLDEREDSSAEASIEELWREIQDLQLTLQQIQEVLDEKMLAIAELEDENEKFREALRVRYGREQTGLPPVPMPNREFIESMLNVPGRGSGGAQPRSASAGSYTIVSEWGRSPEVAAELPGNVSSLVGLAAAVAPGMASNELEALGRELRNTYDAYDNINIQVFDDIEAAKNYADLGKSDPKHLVLGISKHKHSERDQMVRFEDGVPIEVQ